MTQITREDVKKKIIVALDVSSVDAAFNLYGALHGKVGGFKLGFEFFYSTLVNLVTNPDGKAAHEDLDLARHFFRTVAGTPFCDVKLCDIPETVKKALKNLLKLEPLMFNVHAWGGPAMMKTARAVVDEFAAQNPQAPKPLLLAVTVLTSMDNSDLEDIGLPVGYRIPMVKSLAKAAYECGCDGVIASAQDLAAIREVVPDTDFKIFTPGIRMASSAKHDQKAVTTPGEAIKDGATGIIIGRDVTGAYDPAAAVEEIINNILETACQATA
jgi:orotidine-5'-phosphate decarboxylase